MNNLLEQAIAERKHITFDYRNASGNKSKQYVEPLAIHYKWYAWYLFAYSPEKEQYRTFKVARIQNLHVNDILSFIEHGNIEKLMRDSEQAYYQTSIHIEVQFDNEETNLISEYFPDCLAEKLTETTSRIFIDVPAKERLWKALLLRPRLPALRWSPGQSFHRAKGSDSPCESTSIFLCRSRKVLRI